MPSMPLAGRARGPAGRRCALLVLVLTTACRTWRAEPLPIRDVSPRTVDGPVRVTRADGVRIEVAKLRIEGDTLWGERRGTSADDRTAVAVPRDSVRRLEVRRLSVSRTAWLAVGLLATVFLAMSAGEAEAYGPSSR